VKAYYYDAVCAQMLHNADAKYKLEKFISSYPQSREISMAYFYLGNYYYGEKDYGKALGEYRKAERSQINPDKLNEYEFKFGYSFLQTGNSKKAQEYFARVMINSSLYTNTATYYYAHIMYEEGKYEVALSNFEKLLTDNKFSKIVPYYIAQIYFHLNKDNELIALAPELINNSNDTRKAEIEQMVAEVYYKQGEYAKALEHYENANATIPNKNAYQMGYCNYQIKEYSKAVSHFSLCIMEADSIAQNALYHVGDIYLKQNKKQEAIPMFLQAAKLDFNHKITEDALYNYAKLTCEMGNSHYNESIKSFHDYLAKYPKTEKKAPAPAPKKSNTSQGKPVFKIQILASDKKLSNQSKQFKGLSPVGYYQEKGLYKYTYGDNTDYNKVLRTKKQIASKFKGAFIVAFKNGKKMDVNQAIKEFKNNNK
jgi:tetratricopeptide (TPR) repeat protein